MEVRRLTADLAWLVLGNMTNEGAKFTVDRGQCIALGSALIKMGNAMPRPVEEPKLEVVRNSLAVPE